MNEVDVLAGRIRAGDRTALGRAITLLESRRADRANLGRRVLETLMPSAGGAVRVGLTGAPGVGKSTFIEAFGRHLTARGHKVAVLAIDPSSARSGGSILGDKTRMPDLSADPRAFIRPSPAAGVLGGVARTTRETLHLCEAAGYDVVLVETVGIGQSETVVAGMVDSLVVLALPGGGDELQGIKKGIVELADLVVVTKVDGPNLLPAEQTRRHWSMALGIIAGDSPWRVPVLLASAVEGRGLPEIWAALNAHRQALGGAEGLAAKRGTQSLAWFDGLVDEGIRQLLGRIPGTAAALAQARARVGSGEQAPGLAADGLLQDLGSRLAWGGIRNGSPAPTIKEGG